jgi:hypothetical protein
MSMSLQVILNRLSKVSDTQTKLSKNRKVEFALIDDIGAFRGDALRINKEAFAMSQEYNEFQEEYSRNLSIMQQGIDEVKERAFEIYGDLNDAWDNYSSSARDLGIDPVETDAYDVFQEGLEDLNWVINEMN